jgi:2,3-bisphosphoglycerate-independent phosphoglycerate mutase
MTETSSPRPRPLVLAILDGFGESAEQDGNAVRLSKMPNLATLASHPHTTIGTSGPDVGLPKGQMGNSEVGHLNFGAGRIALMDMTKIDVAVAEDELRKNAVIKHVILYCKHNKCRLHLFGLVSDGGVHSSMKHLFALIDIAYEEEVPVVVHAFLDGRDTPPKSAGGYLQLLENHLENKGVIGTLSGRYYAMDRDKRWDRVKKAYDAIVRGPAPKAENALDALRISYGEGITDEFLVPTRLGEYEGLKGDFMADFSAPKPEWNWYGEEVGFAFNFRPDRMRELSAMLTRRNLPQEVVDEMLTERGRAIFAFQEEAGWYSTMTEYDAALKLPVAFPKDDISESFGEVIAGKGLTQLRCAETEKYAHVTYFFNGGREEPFAGEDRKLIPSPRDVATYDLKPEMSAAGVAAAVTEAIKSGKYDFILVNFANPDMVGHTGDLAATITAVEAVDKGIGQIVEALREQKGALILTSDHGNCEKMKDEDGKPFTAHTTNPVPLYYVNYAGPEHALRSGGRICDVAPTMLEILGIPQPEKMTGVSLFSQVSQVAQDAKG